MSLQEQVGTLKTEMLDASKRATEAEAGAEKVGILRAKVDLLETEKRRMESKIVDLRVEVASTEISNSDSGKVLLCLLGDLCSSQVFNEAQGDCIPNYEWLFRIKQKSRLIVSLECLQTIVYYNYPY